MKYVILILTCIFLISCSVEQRIKDDSLSMTGKRKKQYTCPHCGKEGGGGIMKQWHFNNCKI
jgi:hypothetical protein